MQAVGSFRDGLEVENVERLLHLRDEGVDTNIRPRGLCSSALLDSLSEQTAKRCTGEHEGTRRQKPEQPAA